MAIGYHMVYKSNKEMKPTSIIVSWVEAQSPLHAVLRHASEKKWMYAPAIAAGLLYDDQYRDQTRPVDRSTAERLAREALHTELPSVTELDEICQEGARLGQEWGPPRSA